MPSSIDPGVVVGAKSWPKILMIVAMVTTILCLHYLTAQQLRYQHALYRTFFYIPLIFGAFWFGWRGALAVAGSVILVYTPFAIHHWEDFSLDDFHRVIEGALFIAIAFILGYLVKKERSRHKALLRAEGLAAVGRAVSEVAHDMKTPLVAIGGFARYLAKHPEKSESSQEKLDVIVKEAARLEVMVREMLDFGKDLQIRPTSTSLNALVEETVDVAGPMAQEAGVELIVETDKDLVEVLLDGPRVRQLLLNLISNGIQACTPANRVTVKTESSKDHVLLRISDEGCGIDAEDRNKIFQPFFSRKKGGTGLGLAIVKKIADAHGAQIDVRDNVPQGTTITISFPK